MKSISAALFIFTIQLMLSCGDNPTEPEDKTRPTVISINPGSNSIDIPVDFVVTVTFSEKMDSTTISLSVSNSSGGNVFGSLALVSDSVLTFTPITGYPYDDSLTILIGTGNTDLAGNSLINEITSSFRTIEDPATTPPSIVSNLPTHGATDVGYDTDVTVTFDKAINPSTLNNSNFTVSNRTGAINYNSITMSATFTPDTPFGFDSTYTVTLSTAIEDTYGNALASQYQFSFTTETLIPSLISISPEDSVIAGDSLAIQYLGDHPLGIDSVQLFAAGAYASTIIGNFSIYEFSWLPSGLTLGSLNDVYAIAYDSAGNMGYSDTLHIHYLWKVIATDGNDGFTPLEVPNDLRRILARSTDSTLEMRIEYAFDWQTAYPLDSLNFDSAVSLAVYFDVDNNVATGKSVLVGQTFTDFGADYRILMGLQDGLLGGDTTLSRHVSGSNWSVVKDTSSLYHHSAPPDTNAMEFGFYWIDIGNPINSIQLFTVNAYQPDRLDPDFLLYDFAPDLDSGFIQLRRDDAFKGVSSDWDSQRFYIKKVQPASKPNKFPNPFN